MTVHYSDFDIETLHHLARHVRRHMTPAQIDRQARIARANMRLQAQCATQWRELVETQHDNADSFRSIDQITASWLANLKSGV